MGKTVGMLLKCRFFLQIQEEQIENDGKENDGKKRPKPSKAVAKAMKTSAKQMEKGWGLHFSAVLNLQLISKFPDFLQARVKGVRTKPTNKTYGKTMKSGQSNGKNPQNKWKKAWDYMSHQFQSFLTFCRVRVEKVRTKPKK